MINELKTLVKQKGDKLEVVSINRIKSLQEELTKFQVEEELNDFQKWIIDNIYHFAEIPEEMRSIIIIAVPRHPAYANITFNKDGKEYKIYGLVNAPLDESMEYVINAVKKPDTQSTWQCACR